MEKLSVLINSAQLIVNIIAVLLVVYGYKIEYSRRLRVEIEWTCPSCKKDKFLIIIHLVNVGNRTAIIYGAGVDILKDYQPEKEFNGLKIEPGKHKKIVLNYSGAYFNPKCYNFYSKTGNKKVRIRIDSNKKYIIKLDMTMREFLGSCLCSKPIK